MDCATVHRWVLKNSAESENLNWILAHTKQCPKCKRPIEKNQGCMHMTCSQCRCPLFATPSRISRLPLHNVCLVWSTIRLARQRQAVSLIAAASCQKQMAFVKDRLPVGEANFQATHPSNLCVEGPRSDACSDVCMQI